jgi:hypothetical protein
MAVIRRRSVLSTSAFPADLALLFNELTGRRADKWALTAAIVIARFRKKRRMSPTFAELFVEVLETPGLRELSRAIDWTEVGASATYSFRHHVAVHWRRSGWITWNTRPRSLREGAAFARASRRHQQGRRS